MYELTPNTSPNKKENLESRIRLLNKSKRTLFQAKREKIAISFLDYVDVESAKKATEYVLINTNIDVAVHVEKEKPATNYRSKQNAPKTCGKEALVIKAEGRTYADLPRVVKSKVDPGRPGVTVRDIRKTKKRDKLLTIDSGETAGKLKYEILNEIQGSSVDIIGRKDTVINI